MKKIFCVAVIVVGTLWIGEGMHKFPDTDSDIKNFGERISNGIVESNAVVELVSKITVEKELSSVTNHLKNLYILSCYVPSGMICVQSALMNQQISIARQVKLTDCIIYKLNTANFDDIDLKRAYLLMLSQLTFDSDIATATLSSCATKQIVEEVINSLCALVKVFQADSQQNAPQCLLRFFCNKIAKSKFCGFIPSKI